VLEIGRMKVKVLTRNPDVYLRETKRDIHKVPRNYDPSLHPFEAPREYVRALNAVKLERVFAKPFIGSLDGHKDGIICLNKHPESLSTIVSGDYNGEVRIWNLAERKCSQIVQAHDGPVRGVCFFKDHERFMTAGQDKTIKVWSLDSSAETPYKTYISKVFITGISRHQTEPRFATCGDKCLLWDDNRLQPILEFKWGVDSVHHVTFNPVETFLLASCASDRGIILYDIRETGPLRKVVMKLKTNQIAWNPMEAYTFVAASEDYNIYSYDTRNLRAPVNVHMDHVSAVTSVDYAPTGREFVTGSYDKTVRIFEAGKGHSRDVYHTKRMQRVACVSWSLDNKYILSASDEMNIRIWKARASEKLGVLRPREKAAMEYADALKEKFANHPEIKRIARHRQVPKHVFHAKQQLRESRKKLARKEANRRAHSRPGSVPFVSEREKNVVGEQE